MSNTWGFSISGINVGADLGEDDLGGAVVDPWDRGQQLNLADEGANAAAPSTPRGRTGGYCYAVTTPCRRRAGHG
jgi:hypothetical protein